MKTRNHLTMTTLLLVFLVSSIGWGQMGQMATAAMQKDKKSIPIGFGATVIDGQLWYLVNIAPELSFGKLGIGLDLNLRYGPADSANKKIRTEDFDEGYDYLRIIRYVRWGQKGDYFYIRLGQLDYSRLGHGFIMYNYRNKASYDLRKLGVELDVDFEKFGLESMYSDFAGRGILGLRGHVRPLKFTSAADIPVIGGFETGATFAVDLHKNANKIYVGGTNPVDDRGSLSVFGLDLGLPIISLSMLKSTLYFDYAKITGYGSGMATGIDLNFSGMGLLGISAKYERRFINEKFIPSYFDAQYERDRFVPLDSVNFVSKAMALENAPKMEGYYGELLISILNTFNIVGGYQSPVGIPNAGILHMELQTGDAIPIVQLSAGYDKRNIGRVFVVDNNSILYATVGYKPYPFLLVSMLYEWTFTERKNDNGDVVGYDTQKRVEPKVSLVINF